jgi:hypothetical protein
MAPKRDADTAGLVDREDGVDGFAPAQPTVAPEHLDAGDLVLAPDPALRNVLATNILFFERIHAAMAAHNREEVKRVQDDHRVFFEGLSYEHREVVLASMRLAQFEVDRAKTVTSTV